MLIRAIRAENFMRFSRVRLENLPQRALVGIEGPNESGKSTLGDAILFALFGRVSFASEMPLDHLIHWGAEYLRVEVEFELAENGQAAEFLIFREIDRAGTNFVRLLGLPERQELATGNMAVAEFLDARLKLDFFEFQQAFYHEQCDRRLVGSTLASFVDRASGVHYITLARQAIEKEIEQLEREYSHYQQDIARNLRQIEKFSGGASRLAGLALQSEKAGAELEQAKARVPEAEGFLRTLGQLVSMVETWEGKLRVLAGSKGAATLSQIDDIVATCPGYEEKRGLLSDSLASLADGPTALMDGLHRTHAMLGDYQELCRSIREARESLESDVSAANADSVAARAALAGAECDRLAARQRSGRRQAWLLVVAVLVFAGLAGVAHVFAAPLSEWLPLQATPRVVFWSVVACGSVSALLLVAKFAASTSLRSLAATAVAGRNDLTVKLETVRVDLDRLRELERAADRESIDDFIRTARGFSSAIVAKRIAEIDARQGDLVRRKGGDLRGRFLALADQEKGRAKRLDGAVDVEEKRLRELEAAVRKARSERDRIDNEMRESQSLSAKTEAFEDKNRELTLAADPIRSQIEDRRLACDLLDEAGRTCRRRTGPILARFLRGFLPKVTGGRYRDVKVSENLDIEVYSQERSDFVRVHELSGGTNEALLLALRLALSQMLVLARVRQPQFVFLDEPFKMMDVDRAIEALRHLPHVSDDLVQIVVVQPRWSDAQRQRFDLLVELSLSDDVLDVNYEPAASTSPEPRTL